VNVNVPKHSNTGNTLRLKGKGVADPKTKTRGDQYVKLRVVLPEKIDKDLDSFVEKWGPKHSYNVRQKLDNKI
jgi:DnaJ-class molecular chaperone